MGRLCFSVQHLDLRLSLFCGQCFRWKKLDNGDFSGFIRDYPVVINQTGELLSVECDPSLTLEKILDYFASDVDYGNILSLLRRDETLSRAISYANGIRVLRQPFFETLISFIISQNNNISRITGIIERLCTLCGENNADGSFRFPSPEVLSSLSETDIAPIRSGFRAKYILDAAMKYQSGTIDENLLRTAPLTDAEKHLMTIKGVGLKVADCVLLFGCERYDAFPRDVWINRVMSELYPNGLPDFVLPYAGIAQQFLFHYARTSGIFNK